MTSQATWLTQDVPQSQSSMNYLPRLQVEHALRISGHGADSSKKDITALGEDGLRVHAVRCSEMDLSHKHNSSYHKQVLVVAIQSNLMNNYLLVCTF